MDERRAFHAGSTGSNPVRGTSLGSADSAIIADFGTPPSAHDLPTRSSAAPLGAVLLWAALALITSLGWRVLHAPNANASNTIIATWYGPGFIGHRFACADHHGLPKTYHTSQRGVAHRTLPCGTRIRICNTERCVTVRVIDRGPYSGATFDLTSRTARDMCACEKPYTQNVTWRRA